MDLRIVELKKFIMIILTFRADVITNVSRPGRFLNEPFIDKYVRSYLHAVGIQSGKQKTTSAALKRGEAT